MKLIKITSLLLVPLGLFAQKIKSDAIRFSYEILPIQPLPLNQTTFAWKTAEAPDEVNNGMPASVYVYNNKFYSYLGGFKEIKDRDAADILISFNFGAFSVVDKKVIRSEGQDATMKPISIFSYEFKVSLPTEITVTTKTGGKLKSWSIPGAHTSVVNFPAELLSLNSTGYPDAGQLESAYLANRIPFQKSAKESVINKYIYITKDSLNRLYGYNREKYASKFYSAKSKKFDYADLDSALIFINAAFDSLSINYKKENHMNWHTLPIKTVAGKAVHIWERNLKQAENNADARIHPELKERILYNLVWGYILLDEYAKAKDVYAKIYEGKDLNMLEKIGKQDFEKMMQSFELQYIANKEQLKLN